MDLIDRDKLKEAIKMAITVPVDCPYDIGYNDMALNAVKIVDSMHTVDAQPVKHGHWIETRRYRDADGCIVSDYSCSECESVLRETNPDDRDSELYCYRCGAKMDGGKS
jgi:hypothetical protein